MGGAGLTSHEVAETDSGDGNERVVEALDVVPLFGHHEHEGRDHQVDQHSPHNEDGRACDLRLPLVGGGEAKSGNDGDEEVPAGTLRGPGRRPQGRPVGQHTWEEAHQPEEGRGNVPA